VRQEGLRGGVLVSSSLSQINLNVPKSWIHYGSSHSRRDGIQTAIYNNSIFITGGEVFLDSLCGGGVVGLALRRRLGYDAQVAHHLGGGGGVGPAGQVGVVVRDEELRREHRK